MYTLPLVLFFSALDSLPVPLLLFKRAEHALDSELCTCWSLCLEYPPHPRIFTGFPLLLPLQLRSTVPSSEKPAVGTFENQHLSSITSLPFTLLSLWDLSTPWNVIIFLCFNMKRFYLVHCYTLVARWVALSRCSVNCCLVAQLCPTLETPWSVAHQASLSFTISRSLFKLMSIGLIMPSNLLIFCHPLLLPSVFPSIRVSSNESALHIRWPNIGASASA